MFGTKIVYTTFATIEFFPTSPVLFDHQGKNPKPKKKKYQITKKQSEFRLIKKGLEEKKYQKNPFPFRHSCRGEYRFEAKKKRKTSSYSDTSLVEKTHEEEYSIRGILRSIPITEQLFD